MTEKKKEKLLIITDGPALTTGLGRVCREISNRFFEKYELAVAGWHQTPMRHNFPYFIYPIVKGIESEQQIRAILSEFAPDIVLCIGDIWDFGPIQKTLLEYKESFPDSRNILWVTVDGEWIEQDWDSLLYPFDAVVSMSKFGVSEVNKLSQRVKCSVIYPGVDTNVFKPLGKNMKINYGKGEINLQEFFTVLNIGQNHDRKNIPATIDAFAEFAKDKEDVFLFLGTDPKAPSGYNIFAIIKRNKIENKASVIKNVMPVNGVGDPHINMLYNMCDVNINSSIGEGICLPVLEGMAAGCVPIVTNYASAPELIEDNGALIEIAETVYGAYGVVRGIVSKKDIVKHLNIFYEDWKKYKDAKDKTNSIYYKCKAKSIELSKKYNWDNTAAELQKVISDVKSVSNIQRKFIAEKINLETLKPVIVIPSWGKNCGIAEYTKTLVENIEKLGETIAIYPSNDLNVLEQYLDKYNCIYFQHEYSFFQNRIALENFLVKANEKKVKTIFLLHSFAPLYPYLNMLIDKASKIIYHNNRFVEFSKMQRPDAINIEVIPMGCEKPFIEDNTEVKNILNITDRYPIIGSFGFLREQKGYSELLKTIKIMREKYPKILCLISAPKHEFGSSVYDEAFFKSIEDIGLQDNVLIIREYLDDEKLMKTLNAADLFVLNYKDAPNMGGNSAAVKTLMRLCKPIIAPDSISFFHIDEGIYKVKGLNSNKIIENVEKILSDEKLRLELHETCKNFVTKNSWSNIAKLHINALKN